jgi:hypothetical protein
MFLITIFVELRVVAGRSRTRVGSPQAVSQRPCCAVVLRAWHGHGMASVNQTQPNHVHCMGKTHSKLLAARHAMCGSAFTLLLTNDLQTAHVSAAFTCS